MEKSNDGWVSISIHFLFFLFNVRISFRWSCCCSMCWKVRVIRWWCLKLCKIRCVYTRSIQLNSFPSSQSLSICNTLQSFNDFFFALLSGYAFTHLSFVLEKKTGSSNFFFCGIELMEWQCVRNAVSPAVHKYKTPRDDRPTCTNKSRNEIKMMCVWTALKWYDAAVLCCWLNGWSEANTLNLRMFHHSPQNGR